MHITETCSLYTNMRVHLNGDSEAAEFADVLLKIGNGQVNNGNMLHSMQSLHNS